MCDAEEDLRLANRDLERVHVKCEQLVNLIEDVARGIYTPDEGRDEARRIYGAVLA